jgi:hypothetical protein
MYDGNLLNWGTFAVGVILFGIAQLHFTFLIREYKKYVSMYGHINKERGTSWTDKDSTVGMFVRMIWTLGLFIIAGLPLFFFTDLPKRGIYLWLGCTLLAVGLFLIYVVSSNRSRLAKIRVEINAQNITGKTANEK